MHGRAKGTAEHYWPWGVFFKILKFRQGSGPEGENSPLCSIGHRPLRVRCPAWKKDGPGPVMVSSTLCPAVHILGSQNVYSRAEGIADHYWPRPIFCCYYFTILDKEVFILLKPTMNSLRNIQEKYVIQDNSPSPQAVSELFD